MKENKISKKQLEILEFIQKATREKGFPPSVREIAAAVGLRSPSTVHAHLKVLDREGYIKREGAHATLCLNVEILNSSAEISISPSDIEEV